ncbi:hypothetical protein HPB52_023031 [Rhipicephalus sanguineus]|uniref:Uncharacterized protein n=1 Tax=Rhipicephalus sanguineus TaxID=34632 RepID=A0A9D4PHJ3_RHISA|nr:hypothetical protein HPB52_023031 [Rhipicephalus sanguineus]
MYVREAAAPIDKAAPCLDEWCDRLGLWLLPNKSNFAKDPCHNFYEYVCYDWSVGREDTSFLGSVVGSAYNIISDRIARSTMPALTRNDLDLFVAFTKVCLADPSFNDSVSEWMSLIRYEMGDDFLVLRSWNWSRIVQATIRHNLLYGLPTIAGVRVGRTQHQPNRAGLFLSVDACLITLFSLSSGDTPAIVSLLTEIIDELPEFGDVVNAATQVKRLALAINLKRGAPFEEKMSCRSLGAIARGVDASTWLKEINRYVPANMTLDNDSDVRIREVTRHSDLYHAFEGRPPAIRALYINLLTVGQILQYRQSHATNVLPKLRVCMHASRNAFRNLWVKLVMDVAGLQLRPLSGPTVENDTVYRAPQLSIGYHMPQYLVQTSAFQVKRSYNQFIDEYSLSGDREAINLKPTYNVDDLTISVHFFLLFPPVFYVYREEQFHNFATLGVLLALELIREAGRRSLLDWQAAAERGQTCRLEPATGSDAQIKELFIWELAVGAALRSLEIYAKRTMSPLETLHYGKQLRQVFFERFCMLSCMPKNTESTKQRCVVPSMNLLEFSVAFQCAEKGTRKCGET